MSNTVPGMQPPPDVNGPFRGSSAVASGLLTRGVLRGRRYRRLFPGVYVPAALEVDLALRARAADVLVTGRGVVAGYAAPSCSARRARHPTRLWTCSPGTTTAGSGSGCVVNVSPPTRRRWSAVHRSPRPGARPTAWPDGRRPSLDLVREAALTAAGWRVLRFDADEVLFRPDRLVATVRTELGR
jgi:hypothetical protein